MSTIPLTQGKVAIVDAADYKSLNKYKWYALRDRCKHLFYVARGAGGKHKQKREFMHRMILGLKPGDKVQCDHIDGNGLNNQRSNLRVCTAKENQRSSRKRKNTTSIYKGVYQHSNCHKWVAQIRIDGNRIYLGLYNLEIDAARIYDQTALKHFGRFALTNRMLELY